MNDLAYHIGQNGILFELFVGFEIVSVECKRDLALPPQIGHFACRLFKNDWFFPSIRRCVDFDFSDLEVIFNLSARCNYQLLK